MCVSWPFYCGIKHFQSKASRQFRTSEKSPQRQSMSKTPASAHKKIKWLSKNKSRSWALLLINVLWCDVNLAKPKQCCSSIVFGTSFLKPHAFLLFITACTQSPLEQLAVDWARHAGIQTQLWCCCYCCCQAFLCIVYWFFLLKVVSTCSLVHTQSNVYCLPIFIYTSSHVSDTHCWHLFCVIVLLQCRMRTSKMSNVCIWEIEARLSLKSVDHLDKMTKPLRSHVQ